MKRERITDVVNVEEVNRQIDQLTRQLNACFLKAIEIELKRRKMNKSQLADLLGVSSSYVSQLFGGKKLLNLPMMSRIQYVLKCQIEIAKKSDLPEETGM